jgi:hygromycin-B 7''-O-kinase
VGTSHVVKLFPPPFERGAWTERQMLTHVHGRLGVPTAALHAAGELEGWHYLVMEQLPGRALHEAWSHIPQERQRELMEELGGALRRLHALPPLDIPPPHGTWARFLAEQRQGCVTRQRTRGLSEPWLSQLPGFLETALSGLEVRDRPVLLHTEVMREHVLVAEHEGTWRLTGLIDFEPAMQGHPEYELASVGVFLSRGDPTLLRAVCTGYGWPDGHLPREVRQRALAFALLHRYSNFRWYLETVPPRPGTTTLEALADEWWATR